VYIVQGRCTLTEIRGILIYYRLWGGETKELGEERQIERGLFSTMSVGGIPKNVPAFLNFAHAYGLRDILI
jgi:hypothetical protein